MKTDFEMYDLVTEYFLGILGRGGNYQYYQDASDNHYDEIIWFEVGKPKDTPRKDCGTYFNVNPCKKIIQENPDRLDFGPDLLYNRPSRI